MVMLEELKLENFMGINYGQIDFRKGVNCIYGSNGTGKTVLLSAIGIVQILMRGSEFIVGRDIITRGAENSKISATFSVDTGLNRYNVRYSFTLVTSECGECNVCNEAIMAGSAHERMQGILTSESNKTTPIGPTRKIRNFIGQRNQLMIEQLFDIKSTCEWRSRSFLFNDSVLNIFNEKHTDSESMLIINELHKFGLNSIANELDVCEIASCDSDTFLYINDWLNLLAPEANIKIEDHGDDGPYISIGKMCYPMKNASPGIVQIIYLVKLLMKLVQSDYMLLIDGVGCIDEITFGNILTRFEPLCKGQLMIATNNLRPLEIIKPKYIIIATGDPNDAYKHPGCEVAKTNNLRKMIIGGKY
jgi:hypothetical protein